MLELVITIGIFALISVFFLTFQSDVFSLNSLVTNTFSSQQESQQLLVAFINEVRPASNSGTGAYPIAEATSNAFTFYTDIQNVGVKQRIRYFLLWPFTLGAFILGVILALLNDQNEDNYE